MKKVLVLFAICLFVVIQFGIASAGERNGPKCDDPSTYRWDPKTGECIEKIKEQKCEDPSKFRWDPKSGECIEK